MEKPGAFLMMNLKSNRNIPFAHDILRNMCVTTAGVVVSFIFSMRCLKNESDSFKDV